MLGLEQVIENCITDTVSDDFSYLEIGVAYGGTLKGVWDHVSERVENPLVVGVDKTDGWSLSLPKIKELFDNVDIGYYPTIVRGIPIVCLCGVDELFATWSEPLSLCLIDGCHSRKCAAKDFRLVEKHIRPGGIVMFHDAGQYQLGACIQPCCGVGIGVYDALGDLGLIDGTLKGWSKCEFIHGKEVTMAVTRRQS